MILQVTDEDLTRARQRPVNTGGRPFAAWESSTRSSLGAERFEDMTLFSMATEIAISRELGLPPREVDDGLSDFPHGIEVRCRSSDWYEKGDAYLVQNGSLYRPTLTCFRLPADALAVDIRYFVEPAWRWRLALIRNFPNGVGRIVHVVHPQASKIVGAHLDVWERFSRAVFAAEPLPQPPPRESQPRSTVRPPC